jgi:hypothetical protein
VRKACHALALDDERLTFHPLRVDLPEGDLPTSERVEEVWFAGVHSDVGGGYPEDGLAHIPLVWMIDRMAAAAVLASSTPLRLAEGAVDRFSSRACAFEPIHDSRAGLGTFYRYGPRIFDKHSPAEKMPVVHPSVVEKMRVGANLYVPLTLPIDAKVWAERPNLARSISEAFKAVDAATLSRLHDLVWWRRTNYFLTFFATALTVSLPWTADPIMRGIRGIFSIAHLPWDPLATASEGTSVVLGLLRAPAGLLPSYVQLWAEAVIALPLICFPIAMTAIGLYLWGGRLRDKTTRAGRLAWFPPTTDQRNEQRRGVAYVMRHSAVAKGIKTAISEKIASGVIVIALYLVALVFLNHVFLSYQQGAGQLCPIAPENDFTRHTPVVRGPDPTRSAFSFRASERCHATGLRVQRNVPYRIELAVIEPFKDGGEPIELPLIGAVDWRSVAFWPFRRWWTAGWWQPIARIQPDGTEEWPLLPIRGGATSVEGLKVGDSYAAEFTATRDGEVFLFVNDALGAIPFYGPVEGAYANNRGLATLAIIPIDYALPIPK